MKAAWAPPANGQPPKAVLMIIHGGSWKGIDPIAFQSMQAIAKIYQNIGYETVTVDYRHGALGISDVQALYELVRRRVGPKQKICALGPSAGGHLSLMLAVRNPDLACVIDFAGPTDLPALEHDPGGGEAYKIALNAFGAGNLAKYSPALHANSIRARVLMIYAANDPLVPVAQGRDMARADPRARLIVLPPGNTSFVHTGVGAPVSRTGVDAAASQRSQVAQVQFLASVAQAR